MVDSISNSMNIYEFGNDNNNSYMSIVMDAIRTNHKYLSEGPCNISLYEKENVYETRFLKLLEAFDEPL